MPEHTNVNEDGDEIFDGVAPDDTQGPTADNDIDEGASDEANFFNPILLRLEKEEQERLAKIVIEDFNNSKQAREKTDWGTDRFGSGVDFDTKYADLVALYEGADEERPERWMCGRSLKIAQAIVEMLVARLTPSIWNEDMIRWRPVEKTDKKRVESVNAIMDWVINVWMRMGKDAQKIIRACIMMGTTYVESFWEVKKKDLDQVERTPVVDELGQPVLDQATGQPMLVEQKLLKVMEKPAVRIIPVTKVYTQPGQTDIQKEPIIKMEDFYYHELEQLQNEGLMENVTDSLKGQIEKTLLDKFGQELEQAEKIADMDAKRRAHLVETLIWYGNYDADKDGFPEELCVMVTLREEVFLRAFKVAKVNRKGERPIRQINFINRIHKLLGIGVLEQVKPLAEEIDAVFRQIQDANTLSILKWGFYDPNSDYSPDEHVAKPRAMYPVTNPSQNVFFPDMQIPTERLLNAIRLVLEFIERLTAASSFVMGKEGDFSGGSGTATKTAAIVGSAEIRFNLPTSNIREGLGEVITDIFDLCHLNMPGGLEKRILGEDNEPVFETAEEVKDAFLQEMDAYLLPNASFGDVATERELAMMLYDKFVVGGNPFIVANPQKLWHATARVFKAFKENPSEWIGNPGTEKTTNNPVEEHTLIREGHAIHAEPQENHLEHLVVHNKFLNSPDILLWNKDMIEILKVHIQEHMQMMGIVLAFQQGGDKGGGLGNQGPSGEQAGARGPAEPVNGQQALQGSANPAQSAAANQTQGTTLGTPQVG
jgi:hypothetical protein